MPLMRLAGRAFVLMCLAGGFLGTGTVAGAQQSVSGSSSVPSKEQVHPELVDSTWGPGTSAAWELVHAGRWDDARDKFAALHAVHPQGLEALIGLGFVARVQGHREEARRWFRQALESESREDVRQQLEATEWDRPGNVDLSGESSRVGKQTVPDWSLSFVYPVVSRFAVTGRIGELGAGDPLRGVFLDSTTDSGNPVRVVSLGGVFTPIDQLVFTAHVDHWSSRTENPTLVSFDATERFGQHFGLRVGARPTGGTEGAPQLSAATDIIFAPGQAMTLEVIQGTKPAPFEARTTVRSFFYFTPARQDVIRAGVIRDTGPTNQATTGFFSNTFYLRPTVGVHADVLTRRGAFARTNVGGGLVFRW